MKAFLYGCLWLCAFPIYWTVPRLPRRAVLRLARVLGALAFRVSRLERRVALANLDLAFGDAKAPADKKALARESFQSFFRAILDFIWFSRDSRRRVERWFRYEPSLEAQMNRLPAVFVTAHFGNWEVLGQAGTLKGAATVSVAAMFPNERLNRLITRKRERLGMEIAAREGALKSLIRALKNGGRVALLMDQNTRISEGGVFVRFFGKAATMSPAAAVLSIRTGAPVIPAFCAAEPDGYYRGYALPPIEPDLPGGADAINQKIADAFEAEIRARPGQWLWMYRRWKYIPSGGRAEDFPFYAHAAVKKTGSGS